MNRGVLSDVRVPKANADPRKVEIGVGAEPKTIEASQPSEGGQAA